MNSEVRTRRIVRRFFIVQIMEKILFKAKEFNGGEWVDPKTVCQFTGLTVRVIRGTIHSIEVTSNIHD